MVRTALPYGPVSTVLVRVGTDQTVPQVSLYRVVLQYEHIWYSQGAHFALMLLSRLLPFSGTPNMLILLPESVSRRADGPQKTVTCERHFLCQTMPQAVHFTASKMTKCSQ